jgi:hypothetical protein
MDIALMVFKSVQRRGEEVAAFFLENLEGF